MTIRKRFVRLSSLVSLHVGVLDVDGMLIRIQWHAA